MKKLGVAARWIFILCLLVLLISGSIAWGFNSAWIYEYGFRKYEVGRTTGLSPQELHTVARGMIDYWNSSQDYVQVTFTRNGQPFPLFTEEEQIHLKDVKGLVWLDYRVVFLAAMIALGYALVLLFRRRRSSRRALARSTLLGSIVTLAVMLVVGVAVFFAFDWLWLHFHFLAFANDFWSTPGYMIFLFGDLWYDAVLIAAGFAAGIAILLALGAWLYLRLTPETSARPSATR